MIGQVGNEGSPAARSAQQALNNPAGAVPGAQVAPAAGTPVNFTITPPNATQTAGTTFQMAVVASGAKDLYSVPLQLQFNPALLTLVNVDSGEFLGRDGQPVAVVHRDEGNGLVTISVSRPPAVRGVDGQGSVCVLTFKANAPGDATVSLAKVGAKDSAQTDLPSVGATATVHIR